MIIDKENNSKKTNRILYNVCLPPSFHFSAHSTSPLHKINVFILTYLPPIDDFDEKNLRCSRF